MHNGRLMLTQRVHGVLLFGASLSEPHTSESNGAIFKLPGSVLVSRARLSYAGRESGQIPIRLWCCILSSSVLNEVGVNMIGCVLKRLASVKTPCSPSSMPKKATVHPIRH